MGGSSLHVPFYYTLLLSADFCSMVGSSPLELPVIIKIQIVSLSSFYPILDFYYLINAAGH